MLAILGWSISGLNWTTTTEQVVFGSYCFHDSPGGNYVNGEYAVARTVYPIDMSSSTNPVLSFWHKYDTYNANDKLAVQVSTNNGDSWDSPFSNWTGYEAAWNFVGPDAISHHFDMHGGRDRGDSTDIAGDWMHIHHNTFQGRQRHVVIRGVPSQGAEIHHNWFAGPVEKKVISSGNTKVYRNVFGPDKTLEE